jgi:molybdopterin converting factor small subunit
VDGARELDASGATVSEVLADLFSNRPQLGDRVTTDDGAISTFVNVYVNDKDIRLLDGVDTPVSEDDVVILLPAMAGG